MFKTVDKELTITKTGPLVRLEFFSDAVFAITITLLVVDLKVPDLVTADHLLEFLGDMRHYFSAYFMTFIIVGMQWADHHTRLSLVGRCDRGLLWMNFLFLMSVAFLPFPAALISRFPHERVAVVFYMSVIALIVLARAGLWRYLTCWRPLVREGLSAGAIRAITRVDAFAIIACIPLLMCSYYWSEYAVYLIVLFGMVSIAIRFKALP